jgi:hypothetical protein
LHRSPRHADGILPTRRSCGSFCLAAQPFGSRASKRCSAEVHGHGAVRVRPNGTVMVQLLGMVLDFLDALAGAVTIAWWWCTWVRPAKQPTRPSGHAEIARFLDKARTRVTSRTVSVASGQPPRRSDVAPPA